MNRQTLKRLAVKGTVAYIAVFSLVLMVAMPAIALMANSIGTKEIRDHSIRSADIRNKAVTTDRIAPRAVRRGKIAKRAIRNEHIYNNINDSKIRYSTKTKVMSIPSSAFTPRDADPDFYNYGGGGAGRAIFIAPVSLPDGAKITKIRVRYLDNTESSDFRVTLRRYNFSTASGKDMSNKLSSSGRENTYRYLQDNTIENHIINNFDNNYYVNAEADATGLEVSQALITYSLAGP